MIQFTKIIELSFTMLKFYESIVISTVKEDVLIEEQHIEELRAICNEHFQNKKFVYIANRSNNYNVNPVIYINLIQTNTLKGIAVISKQLQKLKTANFEKQFSQVPFELFQNEEEAMVWANGIVQQ